MTKLVLTLMASAVISAAALAQQQQPSQPPAQRETQQPGQETKPQREAMPQQMSPRKLETAQVRQLQEALKNKGMQLDVDGRWGPKSDAALRGFQRKQGIAATGQLNKETLVALGAPIPGEGEGPPPSTSPGAPPSGQEQPQQQEQPRQHDQPKQRDQ